MAALAFLLRFLAALSSTPVEVAAVLDRALPRVSAGVPVPAMEAALLVAQVVPLLQTPALAAGAGARTLVPTLPPSEELEEPAL
jgi:hypothetical protein